MAPADKQSITKRKYQATTSVVNSGVAGAPMGFIPPIEEYPESAADYIPIPKDYKLPSAAENCLLGGIEVSYVKFRFPTPPIPKREPVYEFHVEQPKDKYSIDRAVFHPDLLTWFVSGKKYYMPAHNVLYCY